IPRCETRRDDSKRTKCKLEKWTTRSYFACAILNSHCGRSKNGGQVKKMILALAVGAVSLTGVARLGARGTAGASLPAQAANADMGKWEQEARNVTIIRDDWGIAHVFGKSDADAVFGMIYAQAEDDFNRVETNYINQM